MKRFRFPLRPVAVLRAHREMRAREAFAASVHAYVQSEEVLARTRARVAELAGVLLTAVPAPTSPPRPPRSSAPTAPSARRSSKPSAASSRRATR
jgi:hypothetical protein